MRGHWLTVGAGYPARLDGGETEGPRIVHGMAAPAGETAADFAGRGIAAFGIGLPDFQHGVEDRCAIAVDDAAGDLDALTGRVGGEHLGAEVGGIDAADLCEVGCKANMDVGARGLRRGFPELGRGVQHQFPSSLFSNMVERRPRSTMSKR